MKFVQFSISSSLQYPKIESAVNLIHFDFMVFAKSIHKSCLFSGFPFGRDPFLLPFQYLVILGCPVVVHGHLVDHLLELTGVSNELNY